MAKNAPPVTTPTASSTKPTKPTAVSTNPDVVEKVLEILGSLPNGDFFYHLSTILQDTDSGLDCITYTGIIKALENANFPNTNDDVITPLLFDILKGDADLPFSDDDDHFYLVVAKTLRNLIGKEEYPRLRQAIISYIMNINDNDDQNQLLLIANTI